MITIEPVLTPLRPASVHILTRDIAIYIYPNGEVHIARNTDVWAVIGPNNSLKRVLYQLLSL